MFYIFADLTNDVQSVAEKFDLDDDGNKIFANFIMYNSLLDKTPEDRTIIMTYFSFTSLSTVGFGDFNPRSNPERVFTCFVLMFGVAVFSYIMGNFIEILDHMKSIDAEFSDGDTLPKFFGLLRSLNADKPIKYELMEKIEDFFEHKWSTDCNLSISTDEDFALLNQLQYEV